MLNTSSNARSAGYVTQRVPRSVKPILYQCWDTIHLLQRHCACRIVIIAMHNCTNQIARNLTYICENSYCSTRLADSQIKYPWVVDSIPDMGELVSADILVLAKLAGRVKPIIRIAVMIPVKHWCKEDTRTTRGLPGLLMTSSFTEMPSKYCFKMVRRSAFSEPKRSFSFSIAALSSVTCNPKNSSSLGAHFQICGTICQVDVNLTGSLLEVCAQEILQNIRRTNCSFSAEPSVSTNSSQ